MFYTVQWTQVDNVEEMDFDTYQDALAFFMCLDTTCNPRIVVTKGIVVTYGAPLENKETRHD